jgi:cell fate regulator YaaT (PSP1 superfamily)
MADNDVEVVGVEFHRLEKLNYLTTGGLELKAQDTVVAPSPRGIALGTVVEIAHRRPLGGAGGEIPEVLRLADLQDIAKGYRNRLRAEECLRLARTRVEHFGLDMQILSTEFTLDCSRVIFYFWSEGRVDFRNLVRDLASYLRTRIELYQVAARDRAKIQGGIGPCGRECCCALWLREFAPVSVKMTKDQGLSLNPQKISGSCGRLMCCLRYEYETYRDLRRAMPKVGERILLPEGEAEVLEVQPIRSLLSVKMADGTILVVPSGRSEQLAGASRCNSCSASKSELARGDES